MYREEIKTSTIKIGVARSSFLLDGSRTSGHEGTCIGLMTCDL